MVIDARDVVDGLGRLPGFSLVRRGSSIEWHDGADGLDGRALVCLSHPLDPQIQTAFGLAVLLDAWEAHRPGWPVGSFRWVQRVADAVRWPDRREACWEAMAARIRHIAMDARIRRALGEVPRPGTLATLSRTGNVWRFDSRVHDGVMIEWSAYPGEEGKLLGMAGLTDGVPRGYKPVPALAGITDPDKALEAIHAEVCS